MKKIFIIIFLGLFLSSCFSNSGNNDGLIVYNGNENFSLKIPEKWDILDKKNGEIPSPRSGEVELSIRSKTESNSFYNNLIILSEEIQNEENIGKYINSSSISSEKYFEYKKIEEKDFYFENGNKSKINIFEARYDEKTPKVIFLQTVNICSDKRAYHITLAIDNTNIDTKKYEYMLSSFKCKK